MFVVLFVGRSENVTIYLFIFVFVFLSSSFVDV